MDFFSQKLSQTFVILKFAYQYHINSTLFYQVINFNNTSINNNLTMNLENIQALSLGERLKFG